VFSSLDGIGGISRDDRSLLIKPFGHYAKPPARTFHTVEEKNNRIANASPYFIRVL
jgi:hypothetical protein